MPADVPSPPPEVASNPLRCDILTLFPAFFDSPLSTSIVHRARQAGSLHVGVHDIRDHTTDRHRSADDTPYGGGAGMVMKPGPVVRTIEAVERDHGRAHRVLLTPQGQPFSQTLARTLAQHDHLMFICGRYEGIDERVHEHFIDQELSIGDYVLTGGEPAAIVIIDAVVRLRPGVLGNASSAVDESFAEPLLEYPQYTRPHTFREHNIPEILLSGHHGRIARWRREQSLLRTLARRPDLLRQAWPQLPDQDQTFLRTAAPESLRLALQEVMTSGTPTPAGFSGALSSPSSPPAGALDRPRRSDDE